MLSLGITQINNVISETERQDIKQAILSGYNNKLLNSEIHDDHYKNSYGGEVQFEEIYNKLTELVAGVTGLKIAKANSYSRIYFNDSILKTHTDREGLDLTLSIQIDNTFGKYCPIFGKGYDGQVYESNLNDCDGVLIKGIELEHWRNQISGDGYLMCVFFHWTIVGLQYEEQHNFLDVFECKANINKAETEGFVPSAVLQDYDGSKVDIHSRSSQSYNLIDQALNDKMKPYIGNLRLETWQLLKYEEGNQFLAHYDNGGHLDKRLFTILIYLNDDFEGGTTTFPNQNIVITPETGKMIIFKNLNKKVTDSNSMHSGDLLLKGTKYVLVNWGNLPDDNIKEKIVPIIIETVLSRNDGLFSNINVLKKIISGKIANGQEIGIIKLHSTLYSNDDIYNQCYYQNSDIDISSEEANWILENCVCDGLGLFNYTGIDLRIIKKLNAKYFNVNQSVLEYVNEFKPQEPYIFIWARRTDKVIENSVPEYEEYVKMIKALPNLKVIVKTDDIELANKFKQGGYNVIDSMPMSTQAVHKNYNFAMDKLEYVKKLIALTEVAAQSEYFISYGGNVATAVYEKHKNVNNCFLYKNSHELYNVNK